MSSSSSSSVYASRVNAEMLPKFEGKRVILVCEVVENQGNMLIVTGSVRKKQRTSL